jgi:selenocysteine-specific elongation factor
VQVIATAGHVDHGKSALVRALTGMEPDRWAEERRRGLTIDLGFAWLTLPGGERLSFVDVPGHERFVPNMLAGVGPVPAVLFVVAADGGWMPQSAEHLAAIDALGISRGLLAVSRADLADPGPASRRAIEEIGRTSLGRLPAVAVSAVTGQGLPELRSALAELAAGLPGPDPAAPVRLWVDRVFSMTGSGTVVTGTLPAGTIRAGGELMLSPAGRPVRIRAIESLHEKAAQVHGVSRVAVNLRGIAAGQLARGMALVEPGGWTLTATIDVRLTGWPAAGGSEPAPRLPREVAAHIGSARTTARVRPLGGVFARLSLREPLPLHVADRLLLRDPGAARVATGTPAITGAIVLDVSPPGTPRRRPAAAVRRELAGWPDPPAAADLLRRHGLVRPAELRAMGLGSGSDGPAPVTAAGWLADPGHWSGLRERLAGAVAEHAAHDPLAPGMPLEAARAALGLPDRQLVEALAADPGRGTPGYPLAVRDGCVRRAAAPGPRTPAGHQHPPARSPAAAEPGPDPELPAPVADAVRSLRAELTAAPFRAPEAGRLRELGLDRKAIAAAARAGLLLRIGPELVLAPGADEAAARVLARLPQPFTTAQARQALDTTRRVAIPLLEYLDRAGVTRRLPDDRRAMRAGGVT